MVVCTRMCQESDQALTDAGKSRCVVWVLCFPRGRKLGCGAAWVVNKTFRSNCFLHMQEKINVSMKIEFDLKFAWWTNSCTIDQQFIILLFIKLPLYVSTLLRHLQGARSQYLLSYIRIKVLLPTDAQEKCFKMSIKIYIKTAPTFFTFMVPCIINHKIE
jgi:hypothetical protein